MHGFSLLWGFSTCSSCCVCTILSWKGRPSHSSYKQLCGWCYPLPSAFSSFFPQLLPLPLAPQHVLTVCPQQRRLGLLVFCHMPSDRTYKVCEVVSRGQDALWVAYHLVAMLKPFLYSNCVETSIVFHKQNSPLCAREHLSARALWSSLRFLFACTGI